ncbi:hypothetical protein DH2020_033955 [Rehmannia glutinosa]|uniref:Fluoride export protein n=1 Tax=Rehmannia glutinosa TaxID=99300 RepID=A0ABR0VDD2_REHGL
MDHHNRELESRRSGSFGRLSGGGSSRRRSLSISQQFDDDVESESVSEAGDIGDRALHSKRISASGRSTRFSFDSVAENGIVVPIQDDNSFAVPVLENVSTVSVDANVNCLFLVAYSIIFGIETAKGFKWFLGKSNLKSFSGTKTCNHGCISSKSHCLTAFMVMLLLMLALLWGLFGSLAKKEFETGSSEAQLFLACMVGPFGVWIRWFLARLNGHGLGKNGVLKWMPFGTLAANVLAACVMAALATLKKAVHTRNCDTVASGIQFGLLGCLSTVSTFIAEFHAMRESKHPWRAYAYATITFLISIVLGTLIYSVPVWARGYN